jgi:protein SCO1/2
MMVFFGYTFCPDVCPTTLNNIAVAMNQLGDGAKDVQPIFISVDPKRANPSDLAEYTAAFDPRIVGLTGTTAQIAAASKSYNAYFRKIGDTEDYLMDHSPMVYLIGPDGQYVTRFGHRMGPDDITAKMREFFTASKEQLNPKRAALAK